eukprot:629705-Pleurochrysis_carterae.AAC.1
MSSDTSIPFSPCLDPATSASDYVLVAVLAGGENTLSCDVKSRQMQVRSLRLLHTRPNGNTCQTSLMHKYWECRPTMLVVSDSAAHDECTVLAMRSHMHGCARDIAQRCVDEASAPNSHGIHSHEHSQVSDAARADCVVAVCVRNAGVGCCRAARSRMPFHITHTCIQAQAHFWTVSLHACALMHAIS